MKTRILALLFLLASPVAAQLCSDSFTLRTAACPAGALDCTTKGSALSHAELDADIINTIDICKPFDVGSAAVSVQGDWSFLGSTVMNDIADRDWSAVTTDLTVGDATDEGQIRIGNTYMGQADDTVSTTVLDDIFIIYNKSDSIEDIGYMIVSAADVPRFVVAEEGDDLATYNPRSLVIGPAATLANVDENIQCSTNFGNIDCITGVSGADLGVQDDVEINGDLFVNTISEDTSTSGVTIDGLLVKDSGIPEAAVTAHEAALSIASGQYGAASIDGDDLASSIAGDHLTLAAASPDVINVDAELKTKDHCITIADPTTDDEWYTIWRAPTAVTITEIYCEVTGGTSVVFDFEIDDGAITGVNGSGITCTTSGVTDSTLAGDTAMADGNKMDLDMGTVTGTVTQASFCFEYTISD